MVFCTYAKIMSKRPFLSSKCKKIKKIRETPEADQRFYYVHSSLYLVLLKRKVWQNRLWTRTLKGSDNSPGKKCRHSSVRNWSPVFQLTTFWVNEQQYFVQKWGIVLMKKFRRWRASNKWKWSYLTRAICRVLTWIHEKSWKI